MFKQYIEHKNITALLTDCNIRTNTGSSYSKKNKKKITHRNNIGLGPTSSGSRTKKVEGLAGGGLERIPSVVKKY